MSLSAIALLSCLLPQSAPAPGRSWRQVDAGQWRKPPLIEWQRGFADAFELAVAEGRPVLVCVNMDGEPASETFAGVKYRDPEFAKLVAPYVPVIISVDRHNPRDHDDAGRRIPCPRFGRVTCGEHIAPEPLAFALYFRGQATAPRHIGIEPSGRVIFDRYLETDLRVVDATLARHGGALPGVPVPKDAAELVTSRDANDRAVAEANFIAGDAETRRALLAAAAGATSEPFDLIRLGLRDADGELRAAARRALAATATPAALDLVAEAMREADPRSLTELAGVLRRLAPDDAGARSALRVQDALAARSARVDVAAWELALAGQAAPPAAEPDLDEVDRRIGELTRRVRAAPADGAAQLELARETLRFAALQIRQEADPRFALEDARRTALAAAESGAPAWAAQAVRARAAWLLGAEAEAAAAAAEAVGGVIADPWSETSAVVLRLVAESESAAVRKAVEEQKDWEGSALTDAHAAFTVLALHPFGTDALAAAHVDLLEAAGARNATEPVLERALRRFPASAVLHARLRDGVLASGGAGALERTYDRLLADAREPAATQWFAGYATMVGAEFHQRAGDGSAARAAYDRAIGRFEASASANPAYADSAQHYLAMARAGLARLALDAGDVAAAAANIATALGQRPAIAETADGLGRTPLATAVLVRDAAIRSDREDLRAQVEEAVRRTGVEPESRPGR
jgi:hypothetical protein